MSKSISCPDLEISFGVGTLQENIDNKYIK